MFISHSTPTETAVEGCARREKHQPPPELVEFLSRPAWSGEVAPPRAGWLQRTLARILGDMAILIWTRYQGNPQCDLGAAIAEACPARLQGEFENAARLLGDLALYHAEKDRIDVGVSGRPTRAQVLDLAERDRTLHHSRPGQPWIYRVWNGYEDHLTVAIPPEDAKEDEWELTLVEMVGYTILTRPEIIGYPLRILPGCDSDQLLQLYARLEAWVLDPAVDIYRRAWWGEEVER